MKSVNLETIRTFVSAMLSRYQALLPEVPERLSLVYAEGLLLARQSDDVNLPKQIVVIGPTQVGKSTVVNLLLGSEQARASALAGYTRHAQGFCGGGIASGLGKELERRLPRLRQVPFAELTADELDTYSLTSVTIGGDAGLAVWDTPDFDSVSSRDYRATVPSLCALADLVVLVVSKEKYADQSVWEILRLIGTTCSALLMVINKATDDAVEQLSRAVQNKLEQESLSYAGILTLPYVADTRELHQSSAGKRLRGLTQDALKQKRMAVSDAELKTFLLQHWPNWVAPLLQEHHATRGWREAVEHAVTESLQQFERDYLKNPGYRETLDQAIVQLLKLLEIPAMAEPLARVRQVLTWPARTVIKWAKAKMGSVEGRPQEMVILEEIVQQLLMKLQRHSGEQAVICSRGERQWWRQLWLYLQACQDGLRRQAGEMIEVQQRLFQPEIEAAAARLHQHLKEHPATLNALRVTRAGVDMAAVALAIKTGGVGLNDLFLTPAMLSISTMLTEGAVGQYMNSVEKELKQAKKGSIQAHLMMPLAETLAALHAEMPPTGLFALTEQQLADAEQAIEELA